MSDVKKRTPGEWVWIYWSNFGLRRVQVVKSSSITHGAVLVDGESWAWHWHWMGDAPEDLAGVGSKQGFPGHDLLLAPMEIAAHKERERVFSLDATQLSPSQFKAQVEHIRWIADHCDIAKNVWPADPEYSMELFAVMAEHHRRRGDEEPGD